jgi:class 3 adenylate cyclase
MNSFNGSFLKKKLAEILVRKVLLELRVLTTNRGKPKHLLILVWLFFFGFLSIKFFFVLAEGQKGKGLEYQAKTCAMQIEEILKEAESDLSRVSYLYDNEKQHFQDLCPSYLANSAKRKLVKESVQPESSFYRKLLVIDLAESTLFRLENMTWLPQEDLRSDEKSLEDRLDDREYKFYLETAKVAGIGSIYASHLQRRYSTGKSFSDTLDPYLYQADVVFGYPVVDPVTRKLKSVILLYLDFAHVLRSVSLSLDQDWSNTWNYSNGNYVFIFDDEGYMVAHPRLSHIRGFDENGQDVRCSESLDEFGYFPLRMQRFKTNGKMQEFNNRIFSQAYLEVLKHRSGHIKYINSNMSPRLLAFAPIYYSSGSYSKDRIFGGICTGKRLSWLAYISTVPTLLFDSLNAKNYSFLLLFCLFAISYVTIILSGLSGLIAFLNTIPRKAALSVLKSLKILDPSRRNITVLHADIRGFRPFANDLAPRFPNVLGSYVREFHSRMADILRKNDAVICHIINDQIVAVFGVFDQSDSGLREAAFNAVSSALQMQEAFSHVTMEDADSKENLLYSLNRLIPETEMPKLSIGIGSGVGLAGEFSGTHNEDFAFRAIGAPVALAHMLQLQCSGGETLLDQNTVALLPETTLWKLGARSTSYDIKLTPEGIRLRVFSVKKNDFGNSLEENMNRLEKGNSER